MGGEEAGRDAKYALNEKLGATFRSIAQRMRSDFEATRQQLEHRGLKGKAREYTLISDYLSTYLPRSILVRRNVEIISSDGQVSHECDIALCDQTTPPLWIAGDVEVVPIECVHAAIEVRSHLDRAGLEQAWDRISGIKRMPKVAWIPGGLGSRFSLDRCGRSYNHFPTLGFLFAYDSTDLKTLGQTLADLADNTPCEERIDAVWVLEEGSILWGDEGDPWLTALPGEVRLRVIENAVKADSPLPLMTMQLQSLLQTAFMPPFRIGDYMGLTAIGVASYLRPSEPEDSGQ
jgi:hypothetical protein